jgi:pullulanase
LIQLRNHFEAFRRAEYEQVHFFDVEDNPFALGYLIDYENDSFIVLFNADPKLKEEFFLPDGEWNILINSEAAGIESLGTLKGKIILEASTGIVLQKKS